MNRFDRVTEILDEAIGGSGANIGAHGAFWRGLTPDQLVTERVFGHELIEVGQGSSANLVNAVKGEAPFGADMPSPPMEAASPGCLLDADRCQRIASPSLNSGSMKVVSKTPCRRQAPLPQGGGQRER